jgi:hypothetical protein
MVMWENIRCSILFHLEVPGGNPQAFYREAGTSLKRAMNKIVFTKLFVDGEQISDHHLGDAVRDVVEAQRIYFQYKAETPPDVTRRGRTPAAPSRWTGLLGLN